MEHIYGYSGASIINGVNSVNTLCRRRKLFSLKFILIIYALGLQTENQYFVSLILIRNKT